MMNVDVEMEVILLANIAISCGCGLQTTHVCVSKISPTYDRPMPPSHSMTDGSTNKWCYHCIVQESVNNNAVVLVDTMVVGGGGVWCAAGSWQAGRRRPAVHQHRPHDECGR